MKHIEVEQKFHLLNHDELHAKLQESGAKKLREQRQLDVYYNAPHRDFLAQGNISEWLRLRNEDGAMSITYKLWQPRDAKVKSHCDEFESTLGDGEAVRKLLEALDFTELVTVDKYREEWELDEVIIALDAVKELGNFVEFEYHGQASTVDEAHHKIEACIHKLGAKLGDTHTGYPHQVIAKQKKRV
ncbi:MAG TPA: class IV adenylate cyclase [Candidatus Saccharimonadales bacterium]|nr:class IV adenylate cyclase [Candidatus Saccharimonadales bacterium]